MIVKIITTGKSLTINIGECKTVRDIAQKVALSEGVEEGRISLIKRGKPLKLEDTIEKCEIDDSTSLIGVIQKPSPNTMNIPSTPNKEEKKNVPSNQPPTSNQSTPEQFSHMQPPVPLPSSSPLLKYGQPAVTNQTKQASINTSPASPIAPENETDEAYAKRILSEPEMMNNLLVCSLVPQMCAEVMKLIESNDYRLFNYIVKNPGVLVDAIVQASKLPQAQARQSQLIQRQQQMQESHYQSQPQQQPQQIRIELTEQDIEAINTLRSLGFNEEKCIEAYIACNRNVELAANFLFGA